MFIVENVKFVVFGVGERAISKITFWGPTEAWVRTPEVEHTAPFFELNSDKLDRALEELAN